MKESDSLKPLRSPLRYPGGKAFLCKYMARFLHHNKLHPELFVEPFAGGGSISLYLLGKGLVDKVALYDRDPLLASFWQTVFTDGPWLRDKVRRANVTLKAWTKLHGAALNGNRSNAWKCLFLNRTSFSGILSTRAGPLGGQSQSSEFTIDCRFYRDTIAKRLRELWDARGNVEEVGAVDWRATIERYRKKGLQDQNACFLYLDPPFFHKAKRLYNYCFEDTEHEAVIRRLSTLKIPWLLSYDNCKEAVSLFRKHGVRYRFVSVRYTSSARQSRDVKKELVASNLPLPKGTIE